MHFLNQYSMINWLHLSVSVGNESGGISGALGGALTIPLDTIKVRKQVLSLRSTKGIDIVKDIYNERGIYGFYRGIIPRTCQYTLTAAIIMLVYDWVKLMSTHKNVSHDTLINEWVSFDSFKF